MTLICASPEFVDHSANGPAQHLQGIAQFLSTRHAGLKRRSDFLNGLYVVEQIGSSSSLGPNQGRRWQPGSVTGTRTKSC